MKRIVQSERRLRDVLNLENYLRYYPLGIVKCNGLSRRPRGFILRGPVCNLRELRGIHNTVSLKCFLKFMIFF